jgi:hypothetical protein
MEIMNFTTLSQCFYRRSNRVAGSSPIWLSPTGLSPMAKVMWTFANIPPGHSPIGESHMDVR